MGKKTPTKKAAVPVKAVDPRAHLAPTDKHLSETLEQVRAALDKLPKPAEARRGDLVQVLMHIVLCEGLPCGVGQEAVRRIEHGFVDRNEFRITEAFEVEDLLADLQIPDAFDRCKIVRDAVAQIYNDQNSVTLEFLREAGVGDRQNFFNRVPAIPAKIAKYLGHVMSFEEAIFAAEKPGPRILQRIGLEGAAGEKFVLELRQLLAPFGYLPFKVGPDAPPREMHAKPHATPVLSAGCLVLRLAPGGRKG